MLVKEYRNRDTVATWIFALFIVCTFYNVDGSATGGFVDYPTWLLIQKAEFAAYQRVLGLGAVPMMVLPGLASLLLNSVLVYIRPVAVPGGSVKASLVLALLITGATLIVQLTMHEQLSRGNTITLTNSLMHLDLLRWLAGAVRAALTSWMLFRVLQHSQESRVW